MIWEVHKGRLLACTGRSLDPDDIARSPPKSCAGAALLRRPSSALLSAINLLAGLFVCFGAQTLPVCNNTVIAAAECVLLPF